jgi:hypothetical protein
MVRQDMKFSETMAQQLVRSMPTPLGCRQRDSETLRHLGHRQAVGVAQHDRRRSSEMLRVNTTLMSARGRRMIFAHVRAVSD